MCRFYRYPFIEERIRLCWILQMLRNRHWSSIMELMDLEMRLPIIRTRVNFKKSTPRVLYTESCRKIQVI